MGSADGSQSDELDMVRAVVHFDGAAGAAKRIKVDPDEPFPTSMRSTFRARGAGSTHTCT